MVCIELGLLTTKYYEYGNDSVHKCRNGSIQSSLRHTTGLHKKDGFWDHTRTPPPPPQPPGGVEYVGSQGIEERHVQIEKPAS